MNDFMQKVGLHTQISIINKLGNKDINRLIGLHIRYR